MTTPAPFRRLVAVALLAGLTASGCVGSGPGTSPAPSSAPKVVITGRTPSEIEALLRTRQQALASKDLKAFQATIDMTRLTFRRCQQEVFDVAARQGASPDARSVGKIEPYLDSYVRAYVDDGSGFRRLYFRRDGDGWLLTEPKESELGGEKTKTVDGLELSYWGIDEDIIEGFAQAGLETRAFLLKLARVTPSKPYALRLFPTQDAAGPGARCSIAATASTAARSDQYLRFYLYWTGPDFKSPSDYLRAVLTHEGLHWLQEQTVPGINSRLDWWMVEGWPDYVAQTRSANAITFSLCRTTTPTFKQLVDGPYADPNVAPERIAQFYAFANSMIEYLYASFAENAYWDLLQAYRETVDVNVNYPKVLGVAPAEFYGGWLAFAKKKYC